jgi:F-type H+-transporting ATPase subunit c
VELTRLVTELQSVTTIVAAALILIAALGTAISFTILGCKFLDSIARQPELGPMLTVRMFMVAGLIDAFPAISVAIGLLLIFSPNPFLGEILQTVGTIG